MTVQENDNKTLQLAAEGEGEERARRRMENSGQWLEKELNELCKGIETGLDLDEDIISGLVSYCELASPLDAQEYLQNIIGLEAGQSVIKEYLRRRGHKDSHSTNPDVSTSKLHAYVKPRSNEGSFGGAKKQLKKEKQVMALVNQEKQDPIDASNSRDTNVANQGSSRKKKAGKVVSLADAAKGSIVFQQGKPCACQARQHRLVSNCLSCGKIVCEQEGEGPCSFCGALVLKEGSTYAGLDENVVPLTDAEATAEAYAKRLVDYDRNSAARTKVIDDQSDYYEIEGNSWLSMEEKELLRKKKEEIEESERAKRSKVIVTFDLVGRKVMVNEDEVSELESENRLLRPPEEREINRIKPNPTLRVQPVFMDPGPGRKPAKGEQINKSQENGMHLEITGRVQHDSNELKHFKSMGELPKTSSKGNHWQRPSVNGGLHEEDDDGACSLNKFW